MSDEIKQICLMLPESEESPDRTERDRILLPKGVKVGNISDGFYTFDDLYEHRNRLTAALLNLAAALGLECGWSRQYSDGQLCYGGGWNIVWISPPDTTIEIKYHLPESVKLPEKLERKLGPKWTIFDKTLFGLAELASLEL